MTPLSTTPPPLTHGQGLLALYMLQNWECFAPRKVGDPYAPGYFPRHVASALHGIANRTRKTALGQVGAAVCLGCGTSVDLTRTEGDHLIAKAYGGRETLQNTVVLCRPCNSSKGTKDLLEWWLFKGKPVADLPRSVLCVYTREHWDLWGVQVHREPLRAYMATFLTQRAASLPTDAHREALYRAAVVACALAQGQTIGGDGGLFLVTVDPLPGPYLSAYGLRLYKGA